MAQAVTVEKYLSKDGHLYDNLKAAESADAQWAKYNEYDLVKEIPHLERYSTSKIRHVRFPCLVFVEMRDDNYHYLAESLEDIHNICLHVCNLQAPYYFKSVRDTAIVKEILATKNGAAALGFLVDYEMFTTSVENFNKYEKLK